MPHTPNTPNYDLQKIDPTDAVKDFRSLFNDNMDKIDNITGGGGGGAGGKILKNKTLTFSNNVATISDTDIHANSDFAVYYYDETTARNADIDAVSSEGTITFTAQNTPQSTIVCDIVIFGVSGGGGGGTYTAGEGIDIDANNVISLAYFAVVNGELCQVYDDGI